MKIIVKLALSVVILFVCVLLFTILKVAGAGTLITALPMVGMVGAIVAVWKKKKPSTSEVTALQD